MSFSLTFNFLMELLVYLSRGVLIKIERKDGRKRKQKERRRKGRKGEKGKEKKRKVRNTGKKSPRV